MGGAALDPAKPDGAASERASLEHELAWYDATLDAAHWFSLESVEPQEAAMLLCQFNPSTDGLESIKASGAKIEGSDGAYVEHLARQLTDKRAADGVARSMRAWLTLALDCGLLSKKVDGVVKVREGHQWALKYATAHRKLAPADRPLESLAVDQLLLAAPAELITAFGTFTGMSEAWFRKPEGALLAARKVKGVGARGSRRQPLFCPFEVMVWLAGKKRKKGRPFHNEDKPWELLERHFPAVHEKHSEADPRQYQSG